MQPLIQIEAMTKVFYTEEIETHHVRPFRLREIDLALDYRLAGYTDSGQV
jgi:hypothetical protein